MANRASYGLCHYVERERERERRLVLCAVVVPFGFQLSFALQYKQLYIPHFTVRVSPKNRYTNYTITKDSFVCSWWLANRLTNSFFTVSMVHSAYHWVRTIPSLGRAMSQFNSVHIFVSILLPSSKLNSVHIFQICFSTILPSTPISHKRFLLPRRFPYQKYTHILYFLSRRFDPYWCNPFHATYWQNLFAI
jgi:hypothetical protein